MTPAALTGLLDSLPVVPLYLAAMAGVVALARSGRI